MKRHFILLISMGLTVVLTGCQNPDGSQNYTASGALIGGGAGAVTGAAIGGDRHGGEGALVGAVAGMLVGGLIGNSMDQQQQTRLRTQSPQTYERVDQGQPTTVSDIMALARAGVSDDVIIDQIEVSHSVFRLSASDIIDLRDAGVSNRVINYMINTPNTVGASAAVVPNAPPPIPTQPVIVSPGPGYIWVSGEWIWTDHWVWHAGYWSFPPYGCRVWVGGRYWRDGHGWHYNRGHWR